LFVCLFVGTDLHEIFREGWQWANEQIIEFWWRSGSRIWIHIATLVRRALVEDSHCPSASTWCVIITGTPGLLLGYYGITFE